MTNITQKMINDSIKLGIDIAGGVDAFILGTQVYVSTLSDHDLEHWQGMLVQDIYYYDDPSYSLAMYFMVQDEWKRRWFDACLPEHSGVDTSRYIGIHCYGTSYNCGCYHEHITGDWDWCEVHNKQYGGK